MPITLDINLHKHQQKAQDLIDNSPYRVIVLSTGRQFGKSFLCKAACIKAALIESKNVMWVSKTFSSARSHFISLIEAVKDLPGVYITRQAKEIRFSNGGSITIRSAEAPDNLRGESLGLVVLDEAAHYRDGEYIFYSVILPMITATRGKVLIATTPFGRNWFYEIYNKGLKDDKDKFFVSMHFPSSKSPYQDKTTLEIIRKSMPSIQWQTEYLAEFVASISGVFSGVDAAAVEDVQSDPIKNEAYVAGIDVGHTTDSTCITILEVDGRRQVYGARFTDMGTIEPIRKIIGILNHWKPLVTVVETNGVGGIFYSVLKETLSGKMTDKHLKDIFQTNDEIVGGHRLRGKHVITDTKAEMVHDLAAGIEYGRLKILNDESEYGHIQLNEMSTYERRMSKTGGYLTYGSLEGTHDDTVAALYLAYSAMPKVRRKLKPIKKSDKRSPFKTARRMSFNARSG